MFLARETNYNYVGFKDGKHVFYSTDGSECHMAREAKMFVGPKQVSLIMKADGGIEPTFNSRKKLGDALAEKLVAEFLGKLRNTSGQILMDEIK